MPTKLKSNKETKPSHFVHTTLLTDDVVLSRGHRVEAAGSIPFLCCCSGQQLLRQHYLPLQPRKDSGSMGERQAFLRQSLLGLLSMRGRAGWLCWVSLAAKERSNETRGFRTGTVRACLLFGLISFPFLCGGFVRPWAAFLAFVAARGPVGSSSKVKMVLVARGVEARRRRPSCCLGS